jgi:hypothetical protein
MSPEDDMTIEIRTLGDEDLSRGSVDFVTRQLKVSELNDRFRQFIQGLRAIVDLREAETGPFELVEIQFSAEISAEGEFKLVGSGVGISASSGVTFVLHKKNQ